MAFGLGRQIQPNKIDSIPVPGSVGSMGLVACPGVRVNELSGVGRKHLLADIEALKEWGANGVVSFIEPHEFKLNKVQDIPALLQDAGMWWLHLPIVDMEIPDQDFEDQWAVDGERIRHALRIGERVAFHCYAGLGRTGMIAARILVEMGVDNESAIKAVRVSNRRRIQTKRQAEFVRRILPL